RALNRVPGIGASERTFRTYMDVLRLSVWKAHVDSLTADGYNPVNQPRQFKQVADAINIFGGRGALKRGGMMDKAMGLAGALDFAPRNLVVKFPFMAPVRYATLAPGARKVVLRDLSINLGAMIGTAALLKASGVPVGLTPWEDDFMQARFGNHRFDLSFGLAP